MVEAVELVVAALSAGAAAGVSSTASAAVNDAYAGLKALTLKALRRGGTANDGVLDDRTELRAALTAAGAEDDAVLLDAARAVLALTDPHGFDAGKYRIDVHDNQGVQVGDHNTMTLRLEK